MQVDALGFVFEARNVARARIRGVEASYALDLEPWRLQIGTVVQDPEDRLTGERLLRRARHSATASLTRRFGRQELGLDLLVSGDREDFGFPSPTPLAGYTLANLSGAVHLGSHWNLRGNVENLFDEHYATAAGYRSAGRALHLRVGYTLR